jgi:hypothetical protein
LGSGDFCGLGRVSGIVAGFAKIGTLALAGRLEIQTVRANPLPAVWIDRVDIGAGLSAGKITAIAFNVACRGINWRFGRLLKDQVITSIE